MFPVELGRFIYWVPVLELLKIFAQNLHIHHTNDSTSACIIHFIYILIGIGGRNSLRCRGAVWPTLYYVTYTADSDIRVKWGIFGALRLFKVIETGTNQKGTRDFVLVNDSNFGPILHHLLHKCITKCYRGFSQ